MEKSSILLESGTGEVEILKFKVEGRNYAINVVKVKEILQLGDTAKIPNATPSIMGLTLVRGEVVTVIDLRKVLEGKPFETQVNKMTLLCEFNQIKVAFCVDEVVGIHRIKWSDMNKPDQLLDQSLVIANINLEGKIFMLLDFEKIVMDINPQTGISMERMQHVEKKVRRGHRLVLADDSPMIRQILKDTLTHAGYEDMRFFNDGQEALDYLLGMAKEKGEAFKEDIHLLITDIEMPQLDGHTLTRRVKEHPILKGLPVVIFSSLITGDLRHKGEAVGADAQMSKPEIGKLIETIDSLLGI